MDLTKREKRVPNNGSMAHLVSLLLEHQISYLIYRKDITSENNCTIPTLLPQFLTNSYVLDQNQNKFRPYFIEYVKSVTSSPKSLLLV